MKNFWNKIFWKQHTNKYGFPARCVVIDVSLRKDFERSHLPEAINIPIGVINEMIDVIKKFDKTIVIVSNSEQLTDRAYNILLNQGLPVYNGGNWTRFQNAFEYYTKED